MIQHLTAADVAAEAMMVRTTFSGSILIAEGPTDVLLLEKFIDPSHCYLVIAYGKANAIRATEILEERAAVGFLAIVDADHWNISGVHHTSGNVLVTDFYDIEMVVISSAAFERVTAEYGSANKIKRFLQANESSDLRTVVLERCRPLGMLRYLSSTSDPPLNLKFEGLKIKNLADSTSLRIDISRLINTVVSNTGRVGLDPRELLGRLKAAMETEPHEALQLCCGHDVLELLGIGFRRVLGSQSEASLTSREHMEVVFRLSFEWRDFERTALFHRIRLWEEQHTPFIVLAA